MSNRDEAEVTVAITAFNIDRYTTIEAFLDEYRMIGLDTLELNGRVQQHVIEALTPYVERGEIKVCSLHNFCPRPAAVDSVDLELSSPDEDTRRLAISHTQNTIATAHRLGATAIVLHAGDMPALGPLARTLRELYRAGKQDSVEFARTKDELIRRRKQERQAHVDAAKKSIVELAEYTARNGWGVRLGLENRDLYGQIPQLEEYEPWFERLDDLPVYLWYDLGHAEILENLGLGNKRALLDSLGARLLGLHLHDCAGVQDHIVPGTGQIDFELVKPYLRSDVLRVLEYGSHVHPISKIAEGIEYLREKGILDKSAEPSTPGGH